MIEHLQQSHLCHISRPLTTCYLQQSWYFSDRVHVTSLFTYSDVEEPTHLSTVEVTEYNSYHGNMIHTQYSETTTIPLINTSDVSTIQIHIYVMSLVLFEIEIF